VKNRDILISSIAAALAGVIMLIANMARWAAFFGAVGGRDRDDEGGGIIGLLLTMILAPIAAMLIQMAISRSREYQADASGAKTDARPSDEPVRPAPGAGRIQAAEPSAEALPEINFSTFIISLSTQALMHLGEIADPMSEKAETDLPGAKQMIDILSLLQEK